MPYWLFYHVPRLALLERKPSRRLLKADICICGLNVLRLVFVLRHVFSVICMRALKLILWHPVQILGPHDSAERDIPRDKIFRENYRVFSGRRHEPDGEVNGSFCSIWAPVKKLWIQNIHCHPGRAARDQRPLPEPHEYPHLGQLN